jgi:hypothetical protein
MVITQSFIRLTQGGGTVFTGLQRFNYIFLGNGNFMMSEFSTLLGPTFLCLHI